MDRLKTKNVFIDTSIFYQANFAFQGHLLKRLSDDAESNLDLYITDITIKEIESNIHEKIADSWSALVKFRKEGMILRDSTNENVKEIFAFENLQTFESEFKDGFRKYREDAKFNEISIQDVDINNIFNKYFSKQPPFGEGKKKSEFPDAFVLTALERWCKNENEIMYVVSVDEDMKNACLQTDCLIYISRLEELFDFIVNENDYLHKLVLEIVMRKETTLKETIEEEFKEMGFLIEDQDGIVENVIVNSIELDDTLVQFVGKDFASISMEVAIKFSADLEYKDLDNAAYDSEEKKYIFWEYINETVERSEVFPIEVDFIYDEEDQETIIIERVEINENKDISIVVCSDGFYK